jgi:hypothetical protein
MAETKDLVFIFPIIAAGVLLTSLLFPIMSVRIFLSTIIDPAIVGDLLPFGGGIMDELAPYLASVPELSSLQSGFLFLGIAFTAFFILGALLLIISGIRVKTGRKELKKVRRKWLRNGLSYIISELILYFGLVYGVPFAFQQLGVPLEISFTMGIGMILIIVAGGVLILGYILARIKD